MTLNYFQALRTMGERAGAFASLPQTTIEEILEVAFGQVSTANRRPVAESAAACRDLVAALPGMLEFFGSLSTIEPDLSDLKVAELRYAAQLVQVYAIRAVARAEGTEYYGIYAPIAASWALTTGLRELLDEDNVFVEWYLRSGNRDEGQQLLNKTSEASSFLRDCLPAALAAQIRGLESAMANTLKECRTYALWNFDVLDRHVREVTSNPLKSEPLLASWYGLPSEEQKMKNIPDVAMRRSDLMHRMKMHDLAWKKFGERLRSPVFTVVIPGKGSVSVKRTPLL